MQLDVDMRLLPLEVKINASHLKRVSNEELEVVIRDVYTIFILKYAKRWEFNEEKLMQLKVVWKLLSQHMATLNVRRADSESVAGMSKSISVPKDQDLDQTEYGQMARKIGKDLGLSWASDDLPASLVIY